MERRDYSDTGPVKYSGRYDGGAGKTPYTPPPKRPPDSVTDYINRSVDFEGLAGDIRALVSERIQSSIPDEKRMMMDLITQVSELTGEVKELRQQVDSMPYTVFTCPNGQIKDITAELAEIKRLLQKEPRPREIELTELDPVMLGAAHTVTAEPVVQAIPQPIPQVTAPVQPTAPPVPSAPAPAAQPTAPVQPTAAPTPPPPPAPPQETAPEPAAAPEAQAGRSGKKGKKKKKKKKRTVWSVVGNILFYVVLIGVVGGAFLAKSGSGGSPTMIAGYSAFTVLSSSMEDTYPKGSLIITHSVDVNELEVGDDITYMASATSSITHRIISITENYLDTGARAFETQGTMNANPDKEPVAAANVVGKVIFCSVVLGQAATFVSANWPILLFAVVVVGALFAFLRWNFRREDDEPTGAAQKPRKQKNV